MEIFFGLYKAESVIETSTDFVFLENIQGNGPFLANHKIHHLATNTLSMKVGVKKNSSDLIFNESDEPNDFVFDLFHPYFCKLRVYVPNVFLFLVLKGLGKKRMSEITRRSPYGNDGIDVTVLIFSDHC